ncbi:Eco57I restriction-modification methylase [Halanaerobium saccharolyticum]|jgi:hypothetical protein|uniref:site-specific DNA-methyltransferase (adenine-specific) n=1 Tax=Halanaerobium saccharolyticum TaxID=43595 RepID=A0A2T5RFR1_9FIRM|nr:Eco57I restriction-modification methylase domain-containing protein [Halanaerobium saccharolyticum]PTV93207.1 Eco57I restriction-modification methylase [Halanaerobium saccharolyticum]
MDRSLIQKTLNNFGNIYESGIELFEILDYPLKNNTFSKNEYDLEEFLDIVGIKNTSLTKEEKKYIEKVSLLFAFSEGDEEKDNFVKYESEQKIIAGYIFLSVKLKDQEYSKIKIVNISKKINRLLNSPAFIIFKYNEKITLTITDRRINKIDHDKDVIEKTTLIKDINLKEPHAAHIRILEDLNFKDLDANSKDFNDFHKKWKAKLSVRELNKEFYKELSNWFFSSVDKVKFPSPDEAKNADKITADPEKVRENNTQNLIRFLTRIIFVWFLKEKGLIDKKIFDEKYIYENILVKDTEVNNSTYYKAILQNLFFATLNTEMNRDKPNNRNFISSFQNKSSYYGVHNKYRYLRFVKDKNPNLIIDLFDDIPFLNGGLFECLDEVGNNRHHEKRIDMFSDNPKNEGKLIFPDELLFSNENKKEKNSIKGLFNILNKYKFTLEENTPVEEDIALDPELLGRIFENLLASYNPETRDTARKATGSYYTPREIVHYMVDSSIKEYLKTNLDFITEDRLEELFDYNKYEHKFEKKQVEEIVKAIYDIKILDPACGSGAFPMGVLNRLVFLLEKLDPENYIWKEIKMEEIKKEQKDFEERHNELNYIFNLNKNDANYARKLFLIENSIYGVDIQPIAAQISKLRFFISLIIEQKVNKEDKNFGLLTLPNLETKFVTANTLLKIEKPKTLQLGQDEYKKIEEELKIIRNKYFEAKTKSTKDKYKMLDKEKREQLKAALDKIGFNSEISQKIAAWNPYEHNNVAEFFDSEFMFGIKDGFDIVIGNPPYGNLLSKNNKIELKKYYKYFTTSDISSPFLERAVELTKNNGTLSFIITYAISFNKKFSRNRYQLNKTFNLVKLATFDRDKCRIFESMSQSVSILECFKKNFNNSSCNVFMTSKMFRDTPDINNIKYQKVDNYLLPFIKNFNSEHRLPKIGEKENKLILNKLLNFNKKNISKIISNDYDEYIWIRTSGNYWYNAWNKKPYNSSEIKKLYVDPVYKNFIILLMNSSLFYFWFRIYGDGRHMNSDILNFFPVPSKDTVLKYHQIINSLNLFFMEELFSNFDINRNRFITSKVKKSIDLIDLFICKFIYDLEYNEIYHILNYDKNIRGGIKINIQAFNKSNNKMTMSENDIIKFILNEIS